MSNYSIDGYEAKKLGRREFIKNAAIFSAGGLAALVLKNEIDLNPAETERKRQQKADAKADLDQKETGRRTVEAAINSGDQVIFLLGEAIYKSSNDGQTNKIINPLVLSSPNNLPITIGFANWDDTTKKYAVSLVPETPLFLSTVAQGSGSANLQTNNASVNRDISSDLNHQANRGVDRDGRPMEIVMLPAGPTILPIDWTHDSSLEKQPLIIGLQTSVAD